MADTLLDGFRRHRHRHALFPHLASTDAATSHLSHESATKPLVIVVPAAIASESLEDLLAMASGTGQLDLRNRRQRS